jgi:hypothetical protein
MKPTADRRQPLRLSSQTLRNLQPHAVSGAKDHPAATTLSACVGGCKANSRICSL